MLWFDLDNTPHVPVFRPILAGLEKRNIETLVTSRLHAQTEDLLRFWGIRHVPVGIHAGSSKVHKVANLIYRSSQLKRAVKGRTIELAMSHGSRTHLLAARRLGIPYVWMTDYIASEHLLANMLADHILIPAIIPERRVRAEHMNMRKVIRYDGFKEEIYLKDFVPDLHFRKSIGIDAGSILITIRPPSVTANYHDKRGDGLFTKCIDQLSVRADTHCLIVNRTDSELKLIPPEILERGNVSLLSQAVDGLQLIWNSDVVISGGGTMNRESALLGVPTYSIFTGPRPAMDEYLQEQEKLKFIERAEEIASIPILKRTIGSEYHPTNPALARQIIDLILDLRKKTVVP